MSEPSWLGPHALAHRRIPADVLDEEHPWFFFTEAVRRGMLVVRDRCDERMHAAYGCPPNCPCGMDVETGESGIDPPAGESGK